MSVRKRSGKRKLFVLLLLFVLLIAGGTGMTEWRLKPVLRSIACMKARSYATEALNRAASEVLSEETGEEEELECIRQTNDGAVTAVTTNTPAANRLKHQITLRCSEELDRISSRPVEIPLGTLLFGDLFSGYGPCIPLYLSMSGTVSSDFEGRLESGGIDQTVHTLSLVMTADIHVIMASVSAEEQVTTSVLIGETLLIGSSPERMLLQKSNTETPPGGSMNNE